MSEAELHAAIARAHGAGELEVAVNVDAVSRSGAPGFRTTDIVVPPFVIIVLSAYVFAYHGPIPGLLVLAAGAAFWWVVFRPWNRARTEQRIRDLALAKLDDWNGLWRLGGLMMRRRDDPAAQCVSPKDGWQEFARRHLLDPRPPAEREGEGVRDRSGAQ